MRRAIVLLFPLLIVAFAACSEDVQLKRARATPRTVAPDEGGGLDVTREQFCDGRGSPVATELLRAAGTRTCLRPAALFRYSLCACGDATFTGALSTDAFDSSQAAYAPGQSGASVGVDGQLVATGPVQILGSLITAGASPLPITAGPFAVAGSLKTNADLTIAAGDVAIGRDLWVQGEIVALLASTTVAGDVYQPEGRSGASALSVGGQVHSQAFELAPPCACGPDAALDIAAIVEQGRAHSDGDELELAPDALYTTPSSGPLRLDCGRFAFDGGAILDESRVVAHGRTALFIAGDLAITGSFAPDLGERGEMDVFVAGSLALAPGAVLGSLARPGALRLYVAGGGDLVLPASATVAAGLYAPSATLISTDAQSVYGALFVEGYYATGDQSIHYDAALLAAPDDVEGCDDGTPPGGCRSDDACEPPFICQAGSCSARLE